MEAVVNGNGVTTITSPVFRTVQEAASYLESVVDAEDDCALGLQIEVMPPSLGVQCENTEFNVVVTDPRCEEVLVERVFLLTVDPYIPVVEISFDSSSVVESDDHYGVGNAAYLHIVSLSLKNLSLPKCFGSQTICSLNPMGTQMSDSVTLLGMNATRRSKLRLRFSPTSLNMIQTSQEWRW